MNHALFTSKTPEWFTPPEIISDVIEVFGTIDLDPCSPNKDGPVPASLHYTENDDGLKQPWKGKIYVNPPYGRSWNKWVLKALNEHLRGNATEIIILIAARTDTKIWSYLSEFLWCGVTGRLHFSGHKDSAPFPSAVFYIGPNEDDFIRVFRKWGPIYRRVTA